MNISKAAQLLGINVQTLRYYERRGLIPRPARTASGYRRYDAAAIDRVRFIKQAQGHGFTLVAIGELLAARERAATCDEVVPLLHSTIAELDAKIAALQDMRAKLAALTYTCGSQDGCDALVQVAQQPSNPEPEPSADRAGANLWSAQRSKRPSGWRKGLKDLLRSTPRSGRISVAAAIRQTFRAARTPRSGLSAKKRPNQARRERIQGTLVALPPR